MKHIFLVVSVVLVAFILMGKQGIGLPTRANASSSTQIATTSATNIMGNLAVISLQNASSVQTIKRLGFGIVKQVLWSPDNKILAVCSSAGIWLFQSNDLQDDPGLLEDQADCEKLTFSPDNLSIASYGNIDDPTVRVWDIKTGDLKIELQWLGEIPKWIYSLAFSPDSSQLAFGGTSGAQLWDFKTKTQQKFSTLPYGGMTTGLAFSPDGTLLAAAEAYGIDVWDVRAGTKRRVIRGAVAVDVKFSADGKYLVTTSGNNVRLWNITGGQRAVLLNNDNVYSAQFNADGRSVTTGNANTIIEWDTQKFTRRFVQANPVASLQDVALNADNTLAVGINDQRDQVFIWETQSGKLLATVTAFTREMRVVRFSSTSRSLVYGGISGVWLWNMLPDKLLPLVRNVYRSYSVAGFFDEDKQILATDEDSSDYPIWDTETANSNMPLQDLPFGERKAISPNGKLLAIGRPNDSIVLVDIATQKPLQTLSGHTDMIRDLAFSADGKLLVSCANDSTIRIWDISSGQQLLQIKDPAHLFAADVVAFSPDSSEIATVFNDNITIWSVTTGKLIKTLHQPTNNPFRVGTGALAFNSDGAILASAGYDGAIYLWDVETGSLLSRLAGHLDASYSLDFSADGKLLASASEDGTVRVWGIPQ